QSDHSAIMRRIASIRAALSSVKYRRSTPEWASDAGLYSRDIKPCTPGRSMRSLHAFSYPPKEENATSWLPTIAPVAIATAEGMLSLITTFQPRLAAVAATEPVPQKASTKLPCSGLPARSTIASANLALLPMYRTLITSITSHCLKSKATLRVGRHKDFILLYSYS